MWYIHRTKDDVMVGCNGDDPIECTTRLLCDADFVGDPYTLKSTSGGQMDMQGSGARFPLPGDSGGQSSTA